MSFKRDGDKLVVKLVTNVLSSSWLSDKLCDYNAQTFSVCSNREVYDILEDASDWHNEHSFCPQKQWYNVSLRVVPKIHRFQRTSTETLAQYTSSCV